MRRGLAIVALLLALGGVALLGLGYWIDQQFNAPGPSQADVTFVADKGAGAAAIGGELAAANLIRSARIFELGRRFFSAPGPLKAGEYVVAAGSSAAAIVQLLQSGKTAVRKITFAEGLTNAEFRRILAAAEGLTGDVGRLPEQGWLLPETYHYSLGDSRRDIVQRAQAAMRRLLESEWLAQAAGLPLKSQSEALVLASIIEKETGWRGERPRVSAVFINRLRLGMRLQSDPTVIYGITGGQQELNRLLTLRDLKHPTEHNTYVIPALPPTPIANPGRAAIHAAVHPADTDDLYFVASGDGGHVFARTLAGHNRNVAQWRKFVRQQKKLPQ